MKKLTAEKCRLIIANLSGAKKLLGVSMAEECYLEALEIALPILEQQKLGCKSCGGNRHVEIDHGELGIEHMVCDKCNVKPEQQGRGEVEWVDWKGGDCPVSDDQRVHIQLRDGEVINNAGGYCLRWSHKGTLRDIIAYRIIPERATNQNGEQ